MSFSTEIYILRHCTPAVSDRPNRERPLSEIGYQQADSLVPILAGLGLSAVYTSPFRRALDSAKPFCDANGIKASRWVDLREGAEGEELPQIRSRMMAALHTIGEAEDGASVLICTHGGCLWGVISNFDSDFGYEDYRRLGCPDMRRVVYEAGVPHLDQEFTFELCIT
jgi:2,3-bisphosphoglycerate-dependent phosphoglycerate mutase